MIYLRARFYSPELGIFLSRDPFPGFLTQPASLTPYQYAFNNPVRYTDPSGENPLLQGLLGSAISGFGFNEGMCPLEALNTLLNIYFDPPPPEVSPGRLILGTLAGLIFFIPGTILIAAGVIAISTHGDPAGALPLAFGGVLDAIAAEIIYQTWRPLLPQSWPEYIILNPEGALGH